MIHLQLATRNAHKTREFRELLGPEFVLADLTGHSEIEEIAETGASFVENATIKALAVSRHLPGLVLADDSGLEVDSLGGAPGIFSARYAGLQASDAGNRAKLLAAMASMKARGARFCCVLALAEENRLIATVSGFVEGEIIEQERGDAGFGYDSLFRPNDSDKTFAELPPAEKNRLSHRAAATAQLRRFLQTAAGESESQRIRQASNELPSRR